MLGSVSIKFVLTDWISPARLKKKNWIKCGDTYWNRMSLVHVRVIITPSFSRLSHVLIITVEHNLLNISNHITSYLLKANKIYLYILANPVSEWQIDKILEH